MDGPGYRQKSCHACGVIDRDVNGAANLAQVWEQWVEDRTRPKYLSPDGAPGSGKGSGKGKGKGTARGSGSGLKVSPAGPGAPATSQQKVGGTPKRPRVGTGTSPSPLAGAS